MAEGKDAPLRVGDALVRVHEVSKTFASGVRALERVSLAVRAGEFATLLGPSGCGKSTLLRIVAGLSAPNEGAVRLGDPTHAASGVVHRPRVAFVFQQPTLMPWARVAANVRLPLDLARLPRGESEPRVAAALAQVGLADFARAFPRELSGGMQMRVSIARALVTEPELLLMDEPFAALDEITRGRLDLELRELWRARGLTVLFVTHSIVEAVFLSTRVLMMSARPGRILGEVAIDAPHPRDEAWRLSERFAASAQRVSQLLEEADRSGAVAAA
jgi:NitT/TauT family transport system ATP-binding protein